MTNQEIIERFESDKVKASLDIAGGVFVQTDLAHEIVKALRSQPCEDAISRQAVEKITWEEPSYTDALNVLTEVREKIRQLPPVTPQLKTGQWVDDKCSVCGKGIEDLIESSEWYWNESPKYCPFCGIKIQPYKAESGE